MIQITIQERQYMIPQSWNELTGTQLLQVMEVMHGEYPILSGKLKLLKIITGMSWWRFLRTPLELKAEFLYLGFFLLYENNLIEQLIPSYQGYYGPKSDFNNLLMEEFVFCEDFFIRFAESEGKDDGLLNDLVAVLYRPGKKNYNFKINPDGDTRLPFNENVCHYYADNVISKWPVEMKLATLRWYQCCREKMMNDNPDVFSGGNSEPAKYGLLSVMRSIAENGVHGDFDKVSKKYVKLIMMELNEKVEENKREEKAMNNG